MSQTPELPWFCQDSDSCVSALGTDKSVGLSSDEAALRLATVGYNRLRETPPTPKWKVFLSQFQDFMIYVLLAAVVIAAFEGQMVEAIAILTILLLNGVLGFMQEYRAEQALEALKQMAAPTASVLRDGREIEVKSEELVPGDLVYLESGDTIPADGRLIDIGALRTIESALTGESEAVRKDMAVVEGDMVPLGDQKNMVFGGTSVSVGRGLFVVTATGAATEMGKIAEMLHDTEEGDTPIQIELERTGKRIAIAVLIIALLVFAEEVFLASVGQTGSFLSMFAHPEFRVQLTAGLLVAISLAVAAIPEGLPAIVTVALSLGVRRMAEHHAIVKRLHAVETLGSTTFICSDKTGTLTLNKMSVRRLLVGLNPLEVEDDELAGEFDAGSIDHEGLSALLTIAAACNDAHYTADGVLVGDPTETALTSVAHHLFSGLDVPVRVAEIPFDSERKRMTTVHDFNGGRWAFVKGGVDTTLPLCTHARIDGEVVELNDTLSAKIMKATEDYASLGYRTLAFALREVGELGADDNLEEQLTYVGIMGLQDPARPEVRNSVRLAHEAGIAVAMVTGDHALTARAIATQIGILEGTPDERIVTGPEIEAMSDEELAEQAPHIRVYARVNPEHKLRIISALKQYGHIVAMTGDGVNDAPALKRADIGVAMGLVGTDVTREAADIVLADDNFATIVEAVEQGRVVFDNLKKVILFLLSCNMSEVLIVSITSFFSPAAALLPLQILWINLVTDGMPALALGVDPAESGVMARKPRNAGEPILTGERWFQIITQGAVLSIMPLILAYVIAPMMGATDMIARTMLFTTLVLSQLLHTLSFRSETLTVFSLESLKNKWLLLAIGASFALQVLLVNLPWSEKLFKVVPLEPMHWAAVVVISIGSVAIIDAIDWVSNRLHNR